jgi:hypothetical protein
MASDIYDQDGNVLASMELSEQQLALLDRDSAITVRYHTPQLLRGLLGERNGSFTLRKTASRITADDSDTVRQFAALMLDTKRARET